MFVLVLAGGEWYGVIFMTSAGNNLDNSGVFLLLMNTAYSSFLLPISPHQQGCWGCWSIWDKQSWDSWSQMTQGTFHTIEHHAQHIKLWEGGESGLQLKSCLSSQVTFTCDRDGWAPSCLQEGVNPFFYFVCVCVSCFPIRLILIWLYPNPQVFPLLPSQFFPPYHQGKWMNSWMVFSCGLGLKTPSV